MMKKIISILLICLLLIPTLVQATEHEMTSSSLNLTQEDFQRASISAGTSKTIALKSNGGVVAVGSESSAGEISKASDWTGIVEVSAGWSHLVGLKSYGSVEAEGDNDNKQVSWPRSWSNIVQVSAGNFFTAGLKKDGTVVGSDEEDWDGSSNGVSSWTDIVQVAAGGSHTVGLKSDGTVVAVGWNEYDQRNVSDWTDIVQVAAGGSHTVGLKSDGSVVAVGKDNYGQVSGVTSWTGIVQVTAGKNHTIGLKSDGSVVAVGWNRDGQTNVSNWTDIVQISGGGGHTVGLKSDGTVVAVGSDSSGQVSGVASWTDIKLPKPNPPLHVVATSDDLQISVTWDEVVGSENYIVKRSTSSGGPYDIVGETNSTSFTDLNVMNGVTYYYVISGVNRDGLEGYPANEVSSHVNSAPISIAPGYVDREELVGSSLIDLNWEVLRHQSAFQVQILNELEEIVYETDWIRGENEWYTIPEGVLESNQVYAWKVRTQDDFGGTSPYSEARLIKINSLPEITVTSHSDEQQMDQNNITFTWDYSDLDLQEQVGYQVIGSQDNWETWSYHSGDISTASTTHTTSYLVGGEWDFGIKVFDGMEWSEWRYINNIQLPTTYEPNDDAASAFPISYQSTYSTVISSALDVDFYSFESNQTGIHYISFLEPIDVNYELHIYNSNMDLVGEIGTFNEEYFLTESGQTYYIEIISVDGRFSEEPYSFTVYPLELTIETHYQYDDNGNLTNKQTSIQN
ncbi:hypothetical protein [Chengkuizengella axinellae]|uniref:hypothetical protein n=1 Tax=Chengkuizengella axinellae TaxID=3064388 RepID=UPI003526CFD9